MAKNTLPLAPDLQPDRPRSRLLPIASIFVLILLVSPLLLEVASLCYARWAEALDSPVAVRTPILDRIHDWIEVASATLQFEFSSTFDRVPWDPGMVVLVLVVVMALAMLMLRR